MGKLDKLKSLSTFHLKSLALEMGVIEGHTNYQRFIILGWARTGSNFLRGLLNSHPQIITFNELFREYHTIDWGMPGLKSNSPKLLASFQNKPISFLETEVFRKYPQHISAVGFKLFYYHAHQETWQPIWAYLKNQSNLRIIHLKRQNLLKTYLSEMKAWQTGQWVNTSAPVSDTLSIPLDYDQCLEKFTAIRAQEKEYDLFFANNHKLDLLYEDLSRDYQHEIKRIQEFLGVMPEIVRPTTHKQSSQPLSQAISNYFELKEKFAATPWQEFFE